MKNINISSREKYQKIIFKHDVSSFSFLTVINKKKKNS